MEFPVRIILSVIAAVYCGFCVSIVYKMSVSDLSVVEKAFSVIWMGIAIAVYVKMSIRMWKNWLKKRMNNE